MLFDDILVVADRDDNRQLALRAALDLTRDMKARLSVVAFVHDPIVDEATLVSRTEARRLQAKMIAAKRDWLAGIVARHKVEGVAVRQQVAWAIDEVAGKGHRLIVKSGHRSESLVHSPTDWSLLRQAPVPVMIVRNRLRRRPGGSSRRSICCHTIPNSGPSTGGCSGTRPAWRVRSAPNSTWWPRCRCRHWPAIST